MDLDALKSEIESDPSTIGYAPEEGVDKDEAIAALLNAPRVAAPVPTMVTDRGLMSKLGAFPAATILMKLEAASVPAVNATDQARVLAYIVKLALDRIRGEGLDIGDPETHSQLDTLGALGILAAEEVAAIKGLSMRQVSRAERLFGAGIKITAGEVSRALRG